MYNWVKQRLKTTGGGMNVHGGLDGHDDQWWAENCKPPHGECKKFKYGMPDYFQQWYEMFDGTSVDGSTATIPGEENWGPPGYNEEHQTQDDDPDGTYKSPMTSGSKWKASSTTDTTTSPDGKKSKSPMLRCMNNLVTTIHMDTSKEKEVAVAKEIQEHIVEIKVKQKELEEQKRVEEYDRCLEMVRACGAEDDSEEFYVASMIFEQDYKRKVFSRVAPAARLGWLKRCVRDWNQNSVN
ncbi:unnamed protein product [Urochloa humidicola]